LSAALARETGKAHTVPAFAKRQRTPCTSRVAVRTGWSGMFKAVSKQTCHHPNRFLEKREGEKPFPSAKPPLAKALMPQRYCPCATRGRGAATTPAMRTS
jgi:hypothetical protein